MSKDFIDNKIGGFITVSPLPSPDSKRAFFTLLQSFLDGQSLVTNQATNGYSGSVLQRELMKA